MHVNSHEGDKESAAGHRQLDLQHTTVLSKTSSEPVWASAPTSPQNNNLSQTLNSLTAADTAQALQAELS